MMELAFAEMRRHLGRFVAITAALALIVLLVLMLAGLSDGLWYGATGAIRNNGADLDVFSADSLQVLTRSQLPLADVDRVRTVPGVADAGAIGVLPTVTRDGHGERDAAVIGFLPGHPGASPTIVEGRLPATGDAGVAAADAAQRGRLHLGDAVTVEGADAPLRIVGFVDDARFQLLPTLWTTVDTWRTLRDQVQPERRAGETLVQALPVRLAPGADAEQVARRIDTALHTRTVSRDQAVLAIPGAAQMRTTFTQIIVTTLLVAALVVALFFALLTAEKRDLLATLKALGITGPRITGGLLVQALVATAGGLLAGAVLAGALAAALPATFPIVFRLSTAVVMVAGTLVTAVAGVAFSARRVTRIDPAEILGAAP
jgi:putative ABC transport system permease protein